MKPAIAFSIDPFQLQQYRGSLDSLEARFTNFWAGSINYPTRMISRTRRFSFAPIRKELRKLSGPLDDVRELVPLLQQAMRGEPGAEVGQYIRSRRVALERAIATLRDVDDVRAALNRLEAGQIDADDLLTVMDGCGRAAWRWRWFKNYRRIYDVLETEAPPLAIDHYFLMWPGDNYMNVEATREVLKSTFLLSGVEQVPLPNQFAGAYREESDYLAPLEPGRPYMAVLTAYDVRGDWDFYSLAPLLHSDYELALAIDIETVPRGKAQRKMTDAYNVLKEATYGKHAVKDARSERALGAVNYALSRMANENLHLLSYAVLIQAPNLQALDRQTQIIRDQMGARLRLDRVPGAQAEYLKYFTPAPTSTINAPRVSRNTLSTGVAAKTVWGYRKTSRTTGSLWGYDPFEGMPIHYDPWGEQSKGGYENAHLLMVGKAGYGKTVFFNAFGLRRAVAGDQVIFFDPIGKSKWLCEAAGGIKGGAAYYDVSTDAAINILDPLSAEMGPQLDHIIRKLSIILGEIVQQGGRIDFTPRPISNNERGALDRALQDPLIYGPHGERLPRMRPPTAPLLEHLVEALRRVAKREDKPYGSILADEIENVALESRANVYNVHTTLHWDFSSDVVGYNFKEADPRLLPLYYDHGFEALNRWVRSEERQRRNQPLLVLIDEFFYMASIKSLESNVALATKTWRNYRAAMCTGDQNATTYFGQEGAPSQWGPFTANNCLVKIFFRQENTEADVLGRAYRDKLSPEDVEFIKTAAPGECIAIFGDEVHRLTIQLTDQESPYFIR